MNKEKELLKNTLIILFGKIFTQMITFLLLPLYTSLLITQDYGIVDLITTYVSLLAPLLSLQLEYAVFRYLIDSRENLHEKCKIISSSYYILIIIIIIIGVLLLIINNFISIKYINYLYCIIIVTMISNLFLQISRGIGDNISYSLSSFIIGISNTILSIIFLLVFNLGVEGILIANIFSNIFGILILMYRLKICNFIKLKYYSKNVLKELLKYSVPMIPNSISWWTISVSDKTLLSIIVGLSANGIYSISNKLSSIIISIYNIFNLSWTESISVHINDKDANIFFEKMLNIILKIFFSICLVLIGFMPFVFPILIGKNYTESYIYIPFLLIGSFLNIIVGLLSAVYISKKKSKEMMKTTALAAILNVTINLLFIKKFKIWAAVFSTIISYAIVSIYRLYDIQKYLKIKINLKLVIFYFINFALVLLLFFIDTQISIFINLIYTIIICIILNYPIIKFLYRNFEKKLCKKKL